MFLLWSTDFVFISQKTAIFIVTAVKTSNLTTEFTYRETKFFVTPVRICLRKRTSSETSSEVRWRWGTRVWHGTVNHAAHRGKMRARNVRNLAGTKGGELRGGNVGTDTIVTTRWWWGDPTKVGPKENRCGVGNIRGDRKMQTTCENDKNMKQDQKHVPHSCTRIWNKIRIMFHILVQKYETRSETCSIFLYKNMKQDQKYVPHSYTRIWNKIRNMFHILVQGYETRSESCSTFLYKNMKQDQKHVPYSCTRIWNKIRIIFHILVQEYRYNRKDKLKCETDV
jgi:uncharacterized membrane protein YkvA (DUF1232 family)